MSMSFSFQKLHPDILANLMQFCVNDKSNVLFLYEQLELQKKAGMSFNSLKESIIAIREEQGGKIGICLNCSKTKKYLKKSKPRSIKCDEEVMLVFQNKTGVELDLFWINYDGGCRHNGKIHADNSLTLSSYVTHPFVIKKANGDRELFGLYTPMKLAKSHVITLDSWLGTPWARPGSPDGELLKVKKAYVKCIIRSFTIFYEKGIFDRYRTLKSCLSQDLKQMLEVCPHPVLRVLKKVPIFLNTESWFGAHTCPTRGRGMCYHPAEKFLRDRGQDPVKARSIEVYRVEDYIQWREHQPWMIFHEYAHAFHHYIGQHRQDVKNIYKLAMREGLYQSVPYVLGGMQRHYGASNHHEYFAENSEAFFGRNDYYPYTRSQLRSYDPRCYRLLRTLWNLDTEQLELQHALHLGGKLQDIYSNHEDILACG